MSNYYYNFDKNSNCLNARISKKIFDEIKSESNETRYYKFVKQTLRLQDVATKTKKTIKLKDIKDIKLNYFNTYKHLIDAIQTKKQIKKVAKQRRIIKYATMFVVFVSLLSVNVLSQPKDIKLILDGKEKQVQTSQFITSLYSAKVANEYNLANYKYESSDDFSIKDNSVVEINTLKEINVEIDGEKKVVNTYASTMEELIKEGPQHLLQEKDIDKYGLYYKNGDISNSEVFIEDNANYELYYLSSNTKTKKIKTKPKTKYEKSDELENGVTKVKQKGKTEIAIKEFVTLFLNDEKYGSKVETKKVIKKGQPKIVLVGTKAVSSGSSVWDKLAKCETGGRWYLNTGNGYYGGLQFSAGTWRTASKRVGIDVPYAHLASKDEQIKAATWLQKNSGWGQWPGCALKLGLKK